MEKLISKINILLLVFLICLIPFGLYSQKNHVVLLQGIVTERISGKPVSTRILFINDKGKKIDCKSNSIDGAYQQVLNSGETYNVVFKGFISIDPDMKIEIPADVNYKETTLNFSLENLNSAKDLFNYKMFEPNKSAVINIFPIQHLKSFVDFNPDAKIVVTVSSIDSWFNNSKRRVEKIGKKGVKSFVNETYSSKQQLSDLIDSRISTLKEEFKANNVFLKDNAFIKDLQVVPIKKKQQKRLIPGQSKKYEFYLPDYPNVKISLGK